METVWGTLPDEDEMVEIDPWSPIEFLADSAAELQAASNGLLVTCLNVYTLPDGVRICEIVARPHNSDVFTELVKFRIDSNKLPTKTELRETVRIKVRGQEIRRRIGTMLSLARTEPSDGPENIEEGAIDANLKDSPLEWQSLGRNVRLAKKPSGWSYKIHTGVENGTMVYYSDEISPDKSVKGRIISESIADARAASERQAALRG